MKNIIISFNENIISLYSDTAKKSFANWWFLRPTLRIGYPLLKQSYNPNKQDLTVFSTNDCKVDNDVLLSHFVGFLNLEFYVCSCEVQVFQNGTVLLLYSYTKNMLNVICIAFLSFDNSLVTFRQKQARY